MNTHPVLGDRKGGRRPTARPTLAETTGHLEGDILTIALPTPEAPWPVSLSYVPLADRDKPVARLICQTCGGRPARIWSGGPMTPKTPAVFQIPDAPFLDRWERGQCPKD